jgi:hypothetical protein
VIDTAATIHGAAGLDAFRAARRRVSTGMAVHSTY